MYSDLIVDHFTDPSFVGDLESPEFEYEIGNTVCGDRIQLQLNTNDGVITDIAYRAWGCATSVATGDIFCESVDGERISTVAARTSEQIASMLGELEPSQQHCVHILEELHQKLLSVIERQGES